MTERPRAASEDYIKERYTRWATMNVPFDYKRVKSDRIAEIIRDTGGLPAKALEVGVGPGGIAGPLSQKGVRLIGMDLSIDALNRAKQYCAGDDVALVRGSGFTLPFASNSLPLVYASQVLHLFHNDGRLALMREVHRVLAPGGRFVFDMKNRLTHAFRYLASSSDRKVRNFPAQAVLPRLLTEAGFVNVDKRPGLLPRFAQFAKRMPDDSSLPLLLSHTVFFVARKP